MARGQAARRRRSQQRRAARRIVQPGVGKARAQEPLVAAVEGPDSGPTTMTAGRARRPHAGVTPFLAPLVEEAVDAAVLAVERLAEQLAAPDPREAVRAALVASGDAPETGLLTSYDLTRGSLAEQWFYREALAAGFTDVTGDHWPTETTGLEVTPTVVFRVDDHEQVHRLPDGTLALIGIAHGWASVHTVGPDVGIGREACAAFRAQIPAAYLTVADDSRVPITFWSDGPFGPVARLRKIEASGWEPIAGNYSAKVREELTWLTGWDQGPEAEGQLVLWQGEPGTGKTWALRALATEWAPWAEFHYITDPDAFFVKNPSYMIDVLLADSYQAIDGPTGDVVHEGKPDSKWRVLILEDTGELLSSRSKEQYGQGLSRLLNVVDGMIGQGLKVLALVTTNDELGELHPAVARPGRCASQIEFGPLDAAEASAFLGETVEEGGTLAELYARRGGSEYAMGTCAGCSHAYDAHIDGGACSMDGCSCGGYEDADAAEAAVTAGVFVRLHPDSRAELGELAAQAAALGFGLAPLDSENTRMTFRLDFDQPPCLCPPGGQHVCGQFGQATKYETVTLPEAHAPGERLPEATDGVTIVPPRVSAAVEWTAIFAPEGRLTSDGRAFAPGSIVWPRLEEGPLTLMAMIETSEGGHLGAEVAGRIDEIWRDEAANLIRARGVFDTGEYGQKIAGLVTDQTLRGVSVDLAVDTWEVGPVSDWFDDDGNWAPKPDEERTGGDDSPLAEILFGEGEPQVAVVTKAEIGMSTVCPFPAFREARIVVGDSLVAGANRNNPAIWTVASQAGWTTVARTGPEGAESPLAASGAAADLTPCLDCQEAENASEELPAWRPPADAFANPGLEGPTPWTVTDDGRVFGHAAVWGTCHIGITGRCQPPPRSASGYAFYNLAPITCDDGEVVHVGTVTLDTGHAPLGLTANETTHHYDNTGTAAAYVVTGEDEHGIWVAGVLSPALDPDRVPVLAGGKLSGDWRNIDGGLELVALLTVNVPGFPVPRPRQLVAGAQVEALVASGIPVFEQEIAPDDLERFRALAAQHEFDLLAAEAV